MSKHHSVTVYPHALNALLYVALFFQFLDWKGEFPPVKSIYKPKYNLMSKGVDDLTIDITIPEKTIVSIEEFYFDINAKTHWTYLSKSKENTPVCSLIVASLMNRSISTDIEHMHKALIIPTKNSAQRAAAAYLYYNSNKANMQTSAAKFEINTKRLGEIKKAVIQCKQGNSHALAVLLKCKNDSTTDLKSVPQLCKAILG